MAPLCLTRLAVENRRAKVLATIRYMTTQDRDKLGDFLSTLVGKIIFDQATSLGNPLLDLPAKWG